MHASDLTHFARLILAGRRQRDRYFDPVLFSNPAWDILLILFVAEADGQSLTVLESSLAASVPQGVALRWLGFLKQEDMVIERRDPAHPRQTVMELTDHARLSISTYLAALKSLGLAGDPPAAPPPPAG